MTAIKTTTTQKFTAAGTRDDYITRIASALRGDDFATAGKFMVHLVDGHKRDAAIVPVLSAALSHMGHSGGENRAANIAALISSRAEPRSDLARMAEWRVMWLNANDIPQYPKVAQTPESFCAEFRLKG
ncbi:MAG: hypothetical protein JWO78_81 [Micavibrio sp.]|nr:hypothetical protein [Micavibrio sp.]